MSEVLLEWIRAHGAIGVVVLVVLENLGLPWITAPAHAVAAEIVRAGRMSFWAMAGLISAGHMVGATAAWGVMRAGENALARFLSHNEHTEQVRVWLCRWYDRRGSVTLFAGRLVGQIRPWASLAAGMAGVRAGPFVLWTALGSLFYSTALLGIWLTGLRIWLRAPQMRWLLVIAMIVGFFGVTVYFGLRHVNDG